MSTLLEQMARRVVALERVVERLAVVETQYGLKGARVYNSAAITLTTGVTAALTFDSERWDTDGCHSTISNTSRLTCVTPGVYVITGHASFAAHATGRRGLNIRLGGATYIAMHSEPAVTDAGVATNMSIATVYALVAGNYLELMAVQASGGNLDVSAGANYSPEFAMVRVA